MLYRLSCRQLPGRSLTRHGSGRSAWAVPYVHSPSSQLVLVTALAVLMLLMGLPRVWAADGPTMAAVQEYAQTLAAVQRELTGGQAAEARQRLAATPAALRSFEYEYLLARTTAVPGQPADLVRALPAPPVEFRFGVLNEVDRQVAYLCRDGVLRIHDLQAPTKEPRTAAHEGAGALWSGAFSRDGLTFVAGYENGQVVVWDARTWMVRHAFSLGEKWPVRELAVAPDGQALVAESKEALELWSLAGPAPAKVASVGARYNFGEGLAFSPRGDLVATGGMFDIELYDAKSGQKTGSFRHASYTMGLEFSPDGNSIASAPRGNVNKLLSIFRLPEGQSQFNAGPFPQYVAGLAFTPDGRRLVATGPASNLRLFDTTTGVEVLTIARSNSTAKPSLSRDGRLLGWAEKDGFHYIELGAPPAAP